MTICLFHVPCLQSVKIPRSNFVDRIADEMDFQEVWKVYKKPTKLKLTRANKSAESPWTLKTTSSCTVNPWLNIFLSAGTSVYDQKIENKRVAHKFITTTRNNTLSVYVHPWTEHQVQFAHKIILCSSYQIFEIHWDLRKPLKLWKAFKHR